MDTMHVDVARIDADGQPGPTQEYAAVRWFSHQRASPDDNEMSTVKLEIGGGQGTVPQQQRITGDGHGLHIVTAETKAIEN